MASTRRATVQFYNNPMDNIINSYRELAFRMSVHVAANPASRSGSGAEKDLDSDSGTVQSVLQKNVPYTRHLTQVQYAANIPALVLAVVVTLVLLDR